MNKTDWLRHIMRLFFAGHERTVRAKKNILILLVLKGINVAAGLMLVPITLNYLSPLRYGMWLTLASIVGWVNYFDIGLGNGLRNKFAEARGKGDQVLARIYVSTTYVILSGVILASVIVFFVVNTFLNWATILNAPPEFDSELKTLVYVVFSFFALRFVFALIGTILTADQEPAQNSVIEVLSSVLSLFVVFVLTKTTSGSLLALGIAISATSALVPILASFYLFHGKYREVAPSSRYVRLGHGKELVSLGTRFFILQLGSLFMFSSANIIIAQLFDPSRVVPYNIAFRYYNLVSMAYAVILIPFWSAYTEAYMKADMTWIVATFRRLRQVWFGMVAIIIVMTILAARFYELWVGPGILVPISVSMSMGVYVLINSWCNIYVNFINGTSKIYLQTWGAVLVGIVNIPLAILLSKHLHLGIAGIVIAQSMCLLPWCFIWPIQARKIVTGTATGIWNK